MLILITGVSGSGKSTVGAALAESLGWHFVEGDRFHPPENIRRMSAGIPLNDEDRRPWLAALRAEIDRLIADGQDAVLACSGLKQWYRDLLMRGHGDRIAHVHLAADYQTIHARMQQRRHYMKPEMLASQFQDLEPPDPRSSIIVDTASPVPQAVAEIRRRLQI